VNEHPVEGISAGSPSTVAKRTLPWFACGCIPGAVLGVVGTILWLTTTHVLHTLLYGPGNETRALLSLQAIKLAEARFHFRASPQKPVSDYGTLAQLSQAALIDDVLGSGTKAGYLFQAAPSVSTSDFLWFAVANPLVPTTTGDRYFCTNQTGILYYTTAGSFSLNTTDCQIPANAQPVGK
jgi:hypothetical protein